MNVTTSKPTFLVSSYNNVSTGGTWNEELAKSLTELSQAITASPASTYEIEAAEIPDLAEFNSMGELGYSYISPTEETDYYFLDFEVLMDRGGALDYSQELEAMSMLFEALKNYCSKVDGYSFSKCQLRDSDSLKGYILRAYFVKRKQA